MPRRSGANAAVVTGASSADSVAVSLGVAVAGSGAAPKSKLVCALKAFPFAVPVTTTD